MSEKNVSYTEMAEITEVTENTGNTGNVKNVEHVEKVKMVELPELTELASLRNRLAEIGYDYENRAISGDKPRVGMHYTPVSVAAEVVRHALMPFLVDANGRAKTLEEILQLRICDPALGAGVFLLESCFQLTEFLAKQGENTPDIPLQIAKTCLFGADVDPAAVEVSRKVLHDFCIARTPDARTDFLEKNLVCADSLKFWGVEPKPIFDVVVGNPPFLGGRKIRRVLGDDYFHYLTREFTAGESGNADLCAYFFRLAERILYPGGVCGLIATNSISEGDTRKAGLDVLLKNGARIFRVESFPWPGNAAVHVTTVHWQRAKNGVETQNTEEIQNMPEIRNIPHVPTQATLNGKAVSWIHASLKRLDTRATAYQFPENETLCYQGCVLAAKGFILTPEEARELWECDEKYRDVIRPYFTGDDVFSATDTLKIMPRRYVISFQDWTLEQAAEYPRALEIVRERVFPVRNVARRAAHRVYWWRFGDKRPALMKAIQERNLQKILLQTRHSKYLCPVWVPTEAIYSESTILFPTESPELQAVLNSAVHETWVRETSSSLGNELRYSPTDCFNTFPLPNMKKCASTLFDRRAELCRNLNCGLTALMNRFHDPENRDTRILELRECYQENEEQVFRAYDWTDITPEFEFHNTPRGIRFELLPALQTEILYRLTHATNHRLLYS
ncbi:MAG: N-6 DNA methylase [Planctomycetia bacterium]|nr:N-6 DNA methylase [Planctomycetia bacterium]